MAILSIIFAGAFSEVSVNTEPAALELAVKRGGIRHIVVCGHSDCKVSLFLFLLIKSDKTIFYRLSTLFTVSTNVRKTLMLRRQWTIGLEEMDSPLSKGSYFKFLKR